MMYTKKNLVQILTAAFIALALALGTTAPAAAEGPLQDIETVAYGTFNGIEYVKHTGTFVGAASGGSYSAPLEIVAPKDPSQGNGRVLVEPLHPSAEAVIRDSALSSEFLFGRGFSYAAVCFRSPWPFAPDTHACQAFSGATGDGVEIVAAFGRALRADPLAQDLVGSIQKLYVSGLSASSEPLRDLLHSPLGENLFDLSMPVGVPWPGGPHEVPDPDVGRVMVLLTEADVLNLNAAALRGSAATYRSYEVAGAQHVITGPDAVPLSWAPVMRALFIAGDRWATVAAEPPHSIVLADDAAAEDGIARDEDGNALGGIRLPDVELGRGRFVAVEVTRPAAVFGMSNELFPKEIPLFGVFEDLKCVPRADGSDRFPNHETYVQRFTEHAQELVAQGYLLQEDADSMIAEAAASDVGQPEACVTPAPAVLPETGSETSSTLAITLVLVAGLALASVGIGLGRRARTAR